VNFIDVILCFWFDEQFALPVFLVQPMTIMNDYCNAVVDSLIDRPEICLNSLYNDFFFLLITASTAVPRVRGKGWVNFLPGLIVTGSGCKFGLSC
jgi:hypothetical protein